jgi:hypothetical protein
LGRSVITTNLESEERNPNKTTQETMSCDIFRLSRVSMGS